MRARVFLLFLSSCAVVSGLDTLRIDDGGIDAPVADAPADVASDDPSALDAAPDSSDSSSSIDVATPLTPDGIICGSNKPCDGQQICCGINNGGGNYTFSCATSCDGGVRLSCDDPTECDGGGACCLVSDIVSSCEQQCTMTTLELCSGTNQCPKGTSCVPYDSGVMQKIGTSHCQ